MSTLRILHTIRQGQIGGGESHVLSVVQTMDRSQFEPIVLSFTDGPMVDQLVRMGVRVHVISSNRPFDLGTWPAVGRLLDEERIDVIHAHGTRGLSNTLWAARRRSIPVIYTVHGWSFHAGQSSALHLLRLTAERFLIANAHQTICVSEANRNEGKRHIPNLNAEVVFNGINLKRFDPQSAQPDVRAAYGIRPDQFVIGFMARLTFQKDPLTLIDAFCRLAADHPQAVLLLIGAGELQAEVDERIRQSGLGDRIITDGYRQDVPAVLRAMDVFCLPSLWEGMPIGLMEAMAMEKPVVATSVDGTVELVVDGDNGLLVPVQQPDQLAGALRSILTDAPLRQRLASRARLRIVQRHDVRSMTGQLQQIYQSVLVGEPIPRVVYG